MSWISGKMKALICVSLMLVAGCLAEEDGAGWQQANPCSGKPCKNGGSCARISSEKFQCSCPYGYFGEKCESMMPCMANPCYNSGTCINIDAKRYQCSCTSNYVGKRCESPMPCLSSPCKLGGKCTNFGIDSYKCACPANYYGANCEQYMPCYYNPCRNGGTCANVDRENYRCACPPGKMGSTCEQDANCQYANRTVSSIHAVVRPFSSSPSNYKAGATQYCDCMTGYKPRSSYCKVRCLATGEWGAYSYYCVPGVCSNPMVLYNGRFTQTNGNYYNSVTTYNCNPGYELLGDAESLCTTSGRSSTSFTWREVNGTAPYCRKVVACNATAHVANGKMVAKNSTQEFGQMTFTCNEGYALVGDGIARCMKTGAQTITLISRYSERIVTTDRLKWVWIPRCEATCSAPAPATRGSQAVAMLHVARCSTGSSEPYASENCHQAVLYGVHANQSMAGDRYVFSGDEICVGYNETIESYVQGDSSMNHQKLHETSTHACKSFCMPGSNGFKRVLKDETRWSDKNGGIKVTRQYLKFSTFPTGGGEARTDGGPYGHMGRPFYK